MNTHRFRRQADNMETRVATDGADLPCLPVAPAAVVAIPLPTSHPLYQLYRWAYEQAQSACVQRRFQRVIWTSEN